jgi:VanZ family protein
MTKGIKKLSEPNNLLVAGILYTIIITVAFLLPKVAVINNTNVSIDKWVHFFIHFVLIILWLWIYFSFHKDGNVLKSIIMLFLVCVVYGIIIEILQSVLTLNREADYYDVLANVGGSLLGILVFIKTR